MSERAMTTPRTDESVPSIISPPAPSHSSAPAPGSVPGSADTLLLAFLRGRDVACPRCGYNLRDLTAPLCPECQEPLALDVARRRLILAPFLVTLVPGFFSMIMWGLLLAAILVFPGAPPGAYLVAMFCFASGVAAIVLCWQRARFFRLSISAQWTTAIIVWFVHATVGSLLILTEL
jgi:hypothetical protein